MAKKSKKDKPMRAADVARAESWLDKTLAKAAAKEVKKLLKVGKTDIETLRAVVEWRRGNPLFS